jgi:hypothetical protein
LIVAKGVIGEFFVCAVGQGNVDAMADSHCAVVNTWNEDEGIMYTTSGFDPA